MPWANQGKVTRLFVILTAEGISVTSVRSELKALKTKQNLNDSDWLEYKISRLYTLGMGVSRGTTSARIQWGQTHCSKNFEGCQAGLSFWSLPWCLNRLFESNSGSFSLAMLGYCCDHSRSCTYYSPAKPGLWHQLEGPRPTSNHLGIAWFCDLDAVLIASPGHDGFGDVHFVMVVGRRVPNRQHAENYPS